MTDRLRKRGLPLAAPLLDLVRERAAREAGVELELEVRVWRPRG